MNREKFPEKVPFRLTRMMTTAMEVSGIEGNFRSDLHLCACLCRFAEAAKIDIAQPINSSRA